MNAQTWCDLLRFLAVILMSGDRPYPKDKKAFEEAAPLMREKLGIPFLMNKELARDRYISKKQEIERSLSSIHRDQTVDMLVNRLKALPDKKAVAVMLMKISIADGVERENELSIIKRAISEWDMDLDPRTSTPETEKVRIAG